MNKPEAGESYIKVTGGPYAYGDTVTFEYTLEKLKGYEYAMVMTRCYQGDEVVFGVVYPPDYSPTISGASEWEKDGGDAIGRLELQAYDARGGNLEVRQLAVSEDFPVAGP